MQTQKFDYKLPAGPWNDEPDKAQWVDPATNLDCLIVRTDMGHLCGYVGVPEGNPLFGKDYDAINGEISVHGGLTYAAACNEEGKICHVPEPGRPGHIWWFGFDCAHNFDMSPGLPTFGRGQYRNFNYVKDECANLARQIAAIPAPV